MTSILAGRDWVGIIALGVVSICAFLGFGTFFLVEKQPADLVTELSAGAYGAIFASVITMLMLRKQAEHQHDLAMKTQEFAKDQEIFKEQVGLFKQVINQVEKVFLDRRITSQEIKELEFLLMRLQMLVKREETLRSFRRFYVAIDERKFEMDQSSPDTEFTNLTKEDKGNFALFLSECRLDLGLATHDFSEDFKTDVAEQSAESVELSAEGETESETGSPKVNPLAIERIERFLVAVKGQSDTQNARLNHTKQYIAIIVEPARDRKPKNCATFEVSQLMHMWVKINIPKNSEMADRLKTALGDQFEFGFKDGGYRFRVDLGKDDTALTKVEGFVKEAATSKVIKVEES